MSVKDSTVYIMNKTPNISWGAAIFVPFSDTVMTRFVNPKSFLGPFLVHHLKSTIGAGIAGVATAYIAEKCYVYVVNNFFGLAYVKQETVISKAVLFSTEIVVYASVGGALGLAVGLFVPTFTVAAGVAVGVASFVGSQLMMRLITKIIRIVLEDVFGVCLNESNSIERGLYIFMGLIEVAGCAWRSHTHHDYDRLIREAVKSRIKEINPTSLEYYRSLTSSFISEDLCLNEDDFIALCLKYKLYKKDEEELDRIADLLVESIERTAKCLVHYHDKHKYDHQSNHQQASNFLDMAPSLCMTVAWAVINNDALLIEKYEYNGKFQNSLKNALLKRKDENFKPIFFDISEEQGEIINKVYDKVRPFLKVKGSNPKIVLRRTLSDSNLRSDFLIN